MSRPAVVFADEPTGNLDSTSAAEILGFLRHTVDEFAQTIVMVTHDAKAAAYADRILFLAACGGNTGSPEPAASTPSTPSEPR